MDDFEAKEIFKKRNSIITGSHFVYAKKADGWYHGSDYVNKDAIFPYVRDVSELCSMIAYNFRDDGIEVVVGPTVGGVSLAQWVTYGLLLLNRSRQEVLAVYADEEDVIEEWTLTKDAIRELGFNFGFMASGGVNISLSTDGAIKKIVYNAKVGTKRVLKRGYDKIVAGKRCLIVEDIINSGATVQKVIKAIAAAGGEIIGVGALCNRSGGMVAAETLGVQMLYSLLELSMVMFPEDECPICQERGSESVRTDLGKGKEFLIRKGGGEAYA
ncbi:MAG: phosphoribosyltransferase family protein [bacterium]|nr:phosphoribosyltransferase family protein [bacterium]